MSILYCFIFHFRQNKNVFQLTFRHIRCLPVVQYATKRLTAAKYGRSDQRERSRKVRVVRQRAKRACNKKPPQCCYFFGKKDLLLFCKYDIIK